METSFESTFYDRLKAAQYDPGAEIELKDSNTMIEPPTLLNGSNTMTCRMLVEILSEESESPTLLRPRDVTDISDSTRQSWVDGMKRFVESGTEDQRIRPLDFHLSLDGSVEVQPSDQTSPDLLPNTYPSAYRIPPETIIDLEPHERVRRAELFALGSMIYEISAEQAPFESFEDSDIQARYRRAEYPPVTHLPQWPIILSCWSVEFARELSAILSK